MTGSFPIGLVVHVMIFFESLSNKMSLIVSYCAAKILLYFIYSFGVKYSLVGWIGDSVKVPCH